MASLLFIRISTHTMGVILQCNSVQIPRSHVSQRWAFGFLFPMTPSEPSCLISSGLNPNSLRTSSVCSPTKESLLTEGTPGVLDSRGAGRGLVRCSASVMNEARSLLWLWWTASLIVSTGVTQASVPSKIWHHSALVFFANTSANFFFISGQSATLIWGGSSSDWSPSPGGKCSVWGY